MLPAFMAFFYKEAYDAVDWNRGYKFLDNEFRKIMRDSEQINRRVDKLVQVYLKSGEEVWILLHIEIQGYKDLDFPKRMFVSWYRIYDKHNRDVVSFAILSDDDTSWEPSGFEKTLLGTTVLHSYNSVKLLNYKGREAELEANANPFAVIVLAHLDMKATKNNPAARLPAKINRVDQLYKRGLTRKEIVHLFNFIDWLLTLPPLEALVFDAAWAEIEEENRMPFVSRVERNAMERGLEQGLRESIIDMIEMKFQSVPDIILSRLNEIKELETLRQLRKRAFETETLSFFEEGIPRKNVTQMTGS